MYPLLGVGFGEELLRLVKGAQQLLTMVVGHASLSESDLQK